MADGGDINQSEKGYAEGERGGVHGGGTWRGYFWRGTVEGVLGGGVEGVCSGGRRGGTQRGHAEGVRGGGIHQSGYICGGGMWNAEDYAEGVSAEGYLEWVCRHHCVLGYPYEFPIATKSVVIIGKSLRHILEDMYPL